MSAMIKNYRGIPFCPTEKSEPVSLRVVSAHCLGNGFYWKGVSVYRMVNRVGIRHFMAEANHSESDRSFATNVLRSEVVATDTTFLQVSGVDCAEEVAMIESALKQTGHVREVRVSIMTGKAEIGHDSSITSGDLIAAIEKAGLTASREGDDSQEKAAGRGQTLRLVAVCVSGGFTAIGLMLRWFATGLPKEVEITCFVIAIITGGWFILPKALRSLRQLRLDMNVLMTVAVIGAAGIGEWGEAAAVVFLFALSELLESLSVARARRAVQSLMELSPETALVKRDGEYLEVEVEDVSPGEFVRVRSASRVPLDGEVVSGASAINQAPITGESLPVEKNPGDTVYAGTINGEGSLEVRVTKASGDTTLANIVRLVEEAQAQKAPAERFVDRFARIYTPAVMVMALLVFLVPWLFTGEWETWFYRSLVLLVIACPCALVISTPVSVVSGLTAMARRGVLIKGGAYLEAIGKLRALAVDKTGTITEGEPRVVEIANLADHDPDEIVRIAAAIDTHSDHPLARAIVEYAEAQDVDFPEATEYQSRTGKGAEGVIDGHRFFVGNHRFVHGLGVCSDEVESILQSIETRGLSVVVVGHFPHDECEGEVLGVIAVGDTIRSEAKAAVQSLHEAGLKTVIMLSGDNQRTVDAIAREAGIDEALGDLLPDDKIEHIQLLGQKHGRVGMVGDGVNDAPAMAAASVGIAMGAAGTDTAIETADMALMTDDLSKVAEAIHLGRRTLRIIQFNIAFAILIKVVFLILAVVGYTSLWLAILADTGATIIVILNSLQLLRTPSQT